MLVPTTQCSALLQALKGCASKLKSPAHRISGMCFMQAATNGREDQAWGTYAHMALHVGWLALPWGLVWYV